MAGELKGWRPDPFGAHEFRFFSDDGKPTLLVRDGGTTSHDRPPTSYFTPSPREPDPPPEPIHLQPPEPEFTQAATAEPLGWDREHDPLATAHGLTPLSAPTYLPSASLPSETDLALPVSRVTKVVFAVVVFAMAVSAVALVVMHVAGHNGGHPDASSSSTTSTSSTASTDPTTTLALPSALKPSAAAAAAAFISSWASDNQAEASSVATAPAVATLFAGHYTPGLAIDRGCSVAFSPIVCSYGPPGGAAPTDPIYEIYVSQAPGGWYVSGAKINN